MIFGNEHVLYIRNLFFTKRNRIQRVKGNRKVILSLIIENKKTKKTQHNGGARREGRITGVTVTDEREIQNSLQKATGTSGKEPTDGCTNCTNSKSQIGHEGACASCEKEKAPLCSIADSISCT